tara:strand:- start:1144 stop:1344 length:201 start_codon:yes stop_codon:yes gene_type:complete
MEELLKLSQEIVIELDVHSLTMTQKEKDYLESSRESMAFFMDCGDIDRSILEARNIISKLKEIKDE